MKFQKGDVVVITDRSDSMFNGFVATVEFHNDDQWVRLIPNKARPDTGNRAPFYWNPRDLRLVSDRAAGFTITEPVEGRVTLELSWQDAQILTRIVGLTNSGNLAEHSLALYNFVTSMVDRIGRGFESKDYEARVRNGQVYVYSVED